MRIPSLLPQSISECRIFLGFASLFTVLSSFLVEWGQKKKGAVNRTWQRLRRSPSFSPANDCHPPIIASYSSQALIVWFGFLPPEIQKNLDLEPLYWDSLLTRLTIKTPHLFLLIFLIITIALIVNLTGLCSAGTFKEFTIFFQEWVQEHLNLWIFLEPLFGKSPEASEGWAGLLEKGRRGPLLSFHFVPQIMHFLASEIKLEQEKRKKLPQTTCWLRGIGTLWCS